MGQTCQVFYQAIEIFRHVIVLSAMINVIANNIMDDGGSVEEFIVAILVLLPLCTAALGFIVF